jgi:hypothetical protein
MCFRDILIGHPTRCTLRRSRTPVIRREQCSSLAGRTSFSLPTYVSFILHHSDPCLIVFSSKRVKKYLTSHGIRKGLHYDDEGQHGSALIGDSKGFREIVRWLNDEAL